MVAKADAGDIVVQKKVKIRREDTALTLFKKLVPLTRKILTETVPLIESGTAPKIPQNSDQATVFKSRTPEDGRIDWTWTAEEIYNLVRAVTRPYPGAFADLEGKKITIWKADILRQAQGECLKGMPGQILKRDPLTVACGKGAIILKEIE
jgi:methionyl-tRNA formyltransferase